MPRLEVAVSGDGISGEVAGVGGLLEAMELRKLMRGSYEEASVVAIFLLPLLAAGLNPKS